MKLDILAVSSVVLLSTLSSVSVVVEAFSAPAVPGRTTTTTTAPVDKTMKNVDKDPSTSFDPTKGDQPALVRNNKDQVWVEQVRTIRPRFLAAWLMLMLLLWLLLVSYFTIHLDVPM